jgi:hypothetical protein
MSQPPNKKQKTDEETNRVAGEILGEGANRAGTYGLANPSVPGARNKAKVTINDEARYVPPGFVQSAEGYEDYLHTAGDLSSAVYKRPGDIGSLRPNVGVYKYRPLAKDSPSYGVWVDEATKHAFVVYKGTDTGAEWAFQNTSIASGAVKDNPEFQDAYEFYRYVGAEFKAADGWTIDVTGHSLGGAKAMYVAARAEEDVRGGWSMAVPHSITFNPGVGPGIREKMVDMSSIPDEWKTKFLRYPSKEYNLIVRNSDDVVSAFYPRDKANTVTYTNYDQDLGSLVDPMWKIRQHSVQQFTHENAFNDEGSLRSAVAQFLPSKSIPVPDQPALGTGTALPSSFQQPKLKTNGYGAMDDFYDVDLGDLGIEADEIGGAVAGAGAKDIAGEVGAIAASTMFFPLEVLNIMSMEQQAGEIGAMIQSSDAWERSGWGGIAGLTNYKPYIWDSAFDWMTPERQKAKAEQEINKQTLDYYTGVLPYSPNIFIDRARYGEYLKDRQLGKDSWVDNFNVVAKSYALHQKFEQKDLDQLANQTPNDFYSNNSDPFLQTNISTQAMGILLARQYQILMGQHVVSTDPKTGKKQYWLGRLDRNESSFDSGGMKAIVGAVARKKYIDEYEATIFPRSKNGDIIKPSRLTKGYGQGYDRRNIPTYEAAYYGEMHGHEALGTRADMDNYVKTQEVMAAAKALNAQSEMPDGVYGYDPETKQIHFYQGDELKIQDAIDLSFLGWQFFEQAAKNKYKYGFSGPTTVRASQSDSAGDTWTVLTLDELRKYSQTPNKPTLPKKPQPAQPPAIPTNSAPDNKDTMSIIPFTDEMFMPNWTSNRPANLETSQMNPGMRAKYDEWKSHHAMPGGDPSKPLAPANGPHGGSTPAPDVTPRNEHVTHPTIPGNSGLPDADATDGGSKRPNPLDGDPHIQTDAPNPYMNLDPLNPVQEPKASMGESAYSQALSRFTNNAFGNIQTMRASGMNFTRFAEISDLNGTLAEQARDMLAD